MSDTYGSNFSFNIMKEFMRCDYNYNLVIQLHFLNLYSKKFFVIRDFIFVKLNT